MLSRIRRELTEIKTKGQLKSFVRSVRTSPTEVEFRGKKLTDFSSWDYLGLGLHSELKKVSQKSIEDDGLTISSPRLHTGTRTLHLALEERIALFMQMPSALLFSSRNQAVLSLLSSTLNEPDLIICDDSVSAPVLDSAHLIGASTLSVNFSSPQCVSRIEEAASRMSGRGNTVIFMESLCPVTGALAPITEILMVAAKTNSSVVIDETFALGGIGLRGAGVLETGKLSQGVVAILGSFGFGIPGYGAFVAGGSDLIGLLLNRSRTFIMEPPPPQCLCAATSLAIDLVEGLYVQREKIKRHAQTIRHDAMKLGLTVASPSDIPCVMIQFEKPSIADDFVLTLLDRGILAERVPRGTLRAEQSLVRLIFTDSHEDFHIEKLRGALIK